MFAAPSGRQAHGLRQLDDEFVRLTQAPPPRTIHQSHTATPERDRPLGVGPASRFFLWLFWLFVWGGRGCTLVHFDSRLLFRRRRRRRRVPASPGTRGPAADATSLCTMDSQQQHNTHTHTQTQTQENQPTNKPTHFVSSSRREKKKKKLRNKKTGAARTNQAIEMKRNASHAAAQRPTTTTKKKHPIKKIKHL